MPITFQLHIYAALAEKERKFIGERTKAALAAAKARGVKLGGYREGSLDKRIAALKQAADADAQRVIGIVKPLRDSGMTLRQIAAELNKQGVRTPRNGTWTPTGVKRAIERMASASHEEKVLPAEPAAGSPAGAIDRAPLGSRW